MILTSLRPLYRRRGTRRVVEKSSLGRDERDGFGVDKKPSLGGKKDRGEEGDSWLEQERLGMGGGGQPAGQEVRGQAEGQISS